MRQNIFTLRMCCSVVSALDVAGALSEATVVRVNGFMEGLGALKDWEHSTV